MPVDIAADVITNTRLSSDYNVLALAAPEIAERSQPGQFVMLKSDGSREPLLRRPFSVFQILHDRGATIGLSILNKRIGPSTARLFEARPGDRVQCLGPLGRPFVAVSPPTEAWMVAGGVGLAPFAALADALRANGTTTRLYYGARSAGELFFLDEFSGGGAHLSLTTEDGSQPRGRQAEAGRITAPIERDLAHCSRGGQVMIYACGPEAMLAAVATLAAQFGCQSQVSVEKVMGCGLGGCYSCVIPIRTPGGGQHFVRSCIAGPTFRGDEIAWRR
jgi:dihydroorotate dehydrogenase electron transfer subunit